MPAVFESECQVDWEIYPFSPFIVYKVFVVTNQGASSSYKLNILSVFRNGNLEEMHNYYLL